MKPNISLACKKSPLLPPVKMVLGQLPPNPSPNSKANPNPNPNRGAVFFSGNCPDTGKSKRNENQKEIKNNRRKEK